MENIPASHQRSLGEMFPRIYISRNNKGVRIEAQQGGGKGGQNVNKRATKAVLYLNISETDGLTPEQKRILMCHGCMPHANEALKRAWNRITAGGILRMDNQEQRTIEDNVENVLKNLNEELNEALTPRIPRKEGLSKEAKSKIRREKEHYKVAKFKQKKEKSRGEY